MQGCIYPYRINVLRPILLNDEKNVSAVVVLLGALLDVQLGPIPIEDIKEMDKKGLVSCDCEPYLHYAWCKHSCAYAFSRGIVTQLPPLMDPT